MNEFIFSDNLNENVGFGIRPTIKNVMMDSKRYTSSDNDSVISNFKMYLESIGLKNQYVQPVSYRKISNEHIENIQKEIHALEKGLVYHKNNPIFVYSIKQKLMRLQLELELNS